MEKKLKLIITPRAEERLRAMGKEFTMAVLQFASPRGPVPAAVCRLGSPDEKALKGFVTLEKGDLKIRVPRSQPFINDEVIIDLYAAGNMVVPVILTAILAPVCSASCGSCSGGCSGSCPSARHDDEEFL
ncbi:MAG: hypothetical protein ACOYD9_00615 [Pyramidobacter sp.]|jgi:hypothetical protein